MSTGFGQARGAGMVDGFPAESKPLVFSRAQSPGLMDSRGIIKRADTRAIAITGMHRD